MQFECSGILKVILSLKVIYCICSCICLLSCFWWLGSCQAVISTVGTSYWEVLGVKAEGRGVMWWIWLKRVTFRNIGPNPSLYNSSVLSLSSEHNKQTQTFPWLFLSNYTPSVYFYPFLSFTRPLHPQVTWLTMPCLFSSGGFRTMWLNVNISISTRSMFVCEDVWDSHYTKPWRVAEDGLKIKQANKKGAHLNQSL